MLDDVAIKYPGPRCVISKTKKSELMIRIEWINKFEAGKIINLAIDNIHLKDRSASNINKNEHPINVNVKLTYMSE